MILQKYQSLGNDFLIFDCINFQENRDFLSNDEFIDFVCKKSDRRRLGCDQFIVMETTNKADVKITFYNSDGSKAEACGNGTIASGVCAKAFLNKNSITIQTDSGISQTDVSLNGDCATIQLAMPKEIVLKESDKEIVKCAGSFPHFTEIRNVNVGNPHCVLLCNLLPSNWQEIGKEIENMMHTFPYKTNVEFVIPNSKNRFQVFVWERGAGRTFACGTGAVAVAFAMVESGKADGEKPIEITMEGSAIYGNNSPLVVEFKNSKAYLTNSAFFEGKIII